MNNNINKDKVNKLFDSLSDKDKATINSLLGNKEELEKILNSDKAREIMKKLSKGEQNG